MMSVDTKIPDPVILELERLIRNFADTALSETMFQALISGQIPEIAFVQMRHDYDTRLVEMVLASSGRTVTISVSSTH